MHFSATLKSSSHCLPSPDGRHVATLSSSLGIQVREIHSLEVVNTIKLPADFAGPVFGFLWSPSSRLLLVATLSKILVYAAVDGTFQASIKNLVPPGSKPSSIAFGASDTEVCVCSSFGLKFTIYDLVSSKGVDIGNPKFSTPLTARNGFSFRPGTHHLALLTRNAGKDLISIHEPATRQAIRSWAPDTIDAQGFLWSPDGKWLVVWESPAHGHKVLFYTADGDAFKTWLGPSKPPPGVPDFTLGAGVKGLAFSPDSSYLAIADSSKYVSIFNMASVVEAFRLPHSNTITPKDTVQVWQEQIVSSTTGPPLHSFTRAMQSVIPAGRPAKESQETKPSSSLLLFDSSSALIATRLEDIPSTIWVWDLAAAELRAVLLFHTPVASLAWHPTIRESLLVRCEGDEYQHVTFVWDPLSEGPQTIDLGRRLPSTNASGKSHASWLNTEAGAAPTIFFSDAKNYVLASLAESDEASLPWPQVAAAGWSAGDHREESPLELVPASDRPVSRYGDGDEDGSELEDTFVHKR